MSTSIISIRFEFIRSICKGGLSGLFLLTLLFGCGEAESVQAGAQQAGGEASPPLGKLADVAVPLAYRVQLSIDPEQSRFSGEVEIDIALKSQADQIYLHGVDLSMQNLWLQNERGRSEVPLQNYQQLTDDGVARLIFPEPIEVGNLTLGFAYDAPFATDLAGVYKVVSGGEAYIFTQFENIDARRAFPGFDEPRFKTPFTLSLTIPQADQAAANTPVASERLSGDGSRRTVNFKTTPPLPTYLVAFTVGPLDVVDYSPVPPSAVRSRAVPLRAFAVKGKGDLLEYALQETAPLVLEFERYFGVAYPFAKLDLVAVPDFAAGAMENAGLITFRDNLLLLAEDAPASQRRNNVSVNAHEIAHQWFGDLVTMPWWDDIWLNESFATWAGNRTAQVVHPEFSFDRGLQAGALAVMADDSRMSVRRVHEPVNDSNDIANAFDGITYQKGGAVLRMFEGYLGTEIFQQGIRQHLRKYAFGSAAANDFFDSMAEAAGNPKVRDGFASFVDQKGVPLLNLSVTCVGTEDNKVATLEVDQSRYLPLGSRANPRQVWTLPFCYRWSAAGTQHSACSLLFQQHSVVGLDSCPDWIMPNRDGTGYYRWNLSSDHQVRLGEAFDRLNGAEQLSLADSINAGFSAGSVDVRAFMATVPILAHSDTRQVVMSPTGYWRWLHDRLSPDARRRSANRLISVYGKRLEKLTGNASRTPDEDILRTQLSRLLALYAQDPHLREELAIQAREFLAEAERPIDWDRLQLAFTVALEDAPEGPETFIAELEKHLYQSDSSVVRNAILGALASAKTEQSLLASQRLFFSNEIRTNERVNLFFSMLTPEHREATWIWFQTSFSGILELLTVNNQAFLPAIGSGFCSEEKAKALESFFKPRVDKLLGAKRILQQTLEDIRICEARASRHVGAAEAYFREI